MLNFSGENFIKIKIKISVHPISVYHIFFNRRVHKEGAKGTKKNKRKGNFVFFANFVVNGFHLQRYSQYP